MLTRIRLPSQNTISHIRFLTGILLISTEQKTVKQYFLLKGTGQYWFLLNINVKHTNLLGNEQWGTVDSVQTCEKQLPLKKCSF